MFNIHIIYVYILLVKNTLKKFISSASEIRRDLNKELVKITILFSLYCFFGDPFALCFEHLLPWIHDLMLSYPTQSESKEAE